MKAINFIIAFQNKKHLLRSVVFHEAEGVSLATKNSFHADDVSLSRKAMSKYIAINYWR